MVETSLNMFDLVVLAVVGLSALLSFFRGFIREVLSLGAWVGASLITLYTFPQVTEWIRPKVNSDLVASGLASMGTFMVALIGISIFTRLIGKYVKSGSDVGVMDNLLGMTFGAARGILLVAIGYFIMSTVIAEKDYPDWIKTAVSKPYVEKAATWLAEVAPDYMEDLTPLKKDTDTVSESEKPESIKRMEENKRENTSSDTEWKSLDELKDRMGVDN